MKKIILIIIVLFSIQFMYGQKRVVEVYTHQKSAAFIPFINRVQMSDTAVMSFKYETDKDEKIQLLLHFDDPSTADLYKFIDFSGNFKHQKYEIVLAKKAKLLSDYTGVNEGKARPAYIKFVLKNQSFGAYITDGLK